MTDHDGRRLVGASPAAATSAAVRRCRLLLLSLAGALMVSALLVGLLTSASRPARLYRAWSLGMRLLPDDDVVLQQGSADCGPAALLHVLRRRGIPVQLADVTSVIEVHPWGTSAAAIVRGSEAFGLQAAVGNMPFDAIRGLTHPVIALVGFHWVVLEQTTDDAGVIVFDPGLGRLRMPIELLRRSWRGAAVTFGPVRLL